MKKILQGTCIVICIAALLAAAGFFYIKEAMKGDRDGKKIEVTIPEGSSGREIAEILKKNGIIKDSFIFRIAIRKYLPSGKILSGKYIFNSSDSMEEIIRQLEKGVITLNLITIPEGLTLDETAELLQQKNICSADSFIRSSKNSKFRINGKIVDNPEGYLFPNT